MVQVDPLEVLIDRAASDLVNSRYVVALTGAGISTESGIPDFRGPRGIWTLNPDAERRAYRSYETFLTDPSAYWEERLSERGPFTSLFQQIETAQPNQGHLALAELERLGILRCLLTQNVDGLHQKAGSVNVVEYHGSLFKLRCMGCGARFPKEEYDLPGLKARGELPPRCRHCGGAVKADTVSFGEPIPADVARRSQEEAWKCDLMLICATSAVVYPFADLPRLARRRQVERERKSPSGLYLVERVPATIIIEVNAEPTPLTGEGVSDYLIQGMTGDLLPRIVARARKRL